MGDESIALEIEGVSDETLRIFFGGDMLFGKPPTHSVAIETTDIVSGAPPYPKIPVLDLPWWRILERRRIIAERERLVREWELAYRAWEADGKPDREVLVRRYIPRANIEVQDG